MSAQYANALSDSPYSCGRESNKTAPLMSHGVAWLRMDSRQGTGLISLVFETEVIILSPDDDSNRNEHLHWAYSTFG